MVAENFLSVFFCAMSILVIVSFINKKKSGIKSIVFSVLYFAHPIVKALKNFVMV